MPTSGPTTTETYAYNALGALSVHAGTAVDHERPRLDAQGTAPAGIPASHNSLPITLNDGGRVTQLNDALLTYNKRGNLVTAVQPGTSQTYSYDTQGRLIAEQSVPTFARYFQYLGPHISAVLGEGSGFPVALLQGFVYDDLDHPLLFLENTASYSYEVDIIGNVRRLRTSCNFNPGSGGCSNAGADARRLRILRLRTHPALSTSAALVHSDPPRRHQPPTLARTLAARRRRRRLRLP